MEGDYCILYDFCTDDQLEGVQILQQIAIAFVHSRVLESKRWYKYREENR